MTQHRRAFLRTIGAGSLGIAAGTAISNTAAAATVITMEGGGADIWSTEDAFHYYYQSLTGDFDVVVHSLGVENTDPWAKAGLMVRNSLTADAANAMVRHRPNGEASVQWRPDAGADSDSMDAIQADWLRLRRSGETIEAYGSPDGENWTDLGQLGADDIALADEVYVGLAVTSHNAGTLATATFKDLEGLSLEAMTNQDIGDVEVAGSVSTEEGVPFASTDEATDVTADGVTLHGTLDDLGGADAADCYFEYREVPRESWQRTDARTLSEPGSFSAEVSGLDTRRYYEFRAAVEAGDGDSAVGSTAQFATPSRSNGSGGDGGPESKSHFDPDDGFATAAEWLDDETPVVTVREPTRRQLQSALHVDGPRLVVFETSGTIDLGARTLEIPNDECYVAGQTAPSPGITLIRGGLYVEGDDCVVQHIRVRPGDADQDVGWEPDALHTGDDTENNVIDHCTATWGIDENLSVGYDTTDTTLSNCLIAEPLDDATHPKGPHGYGTLVGDGAENVAILGSVYAYNVDRNPRLKEGTQTVLVNNLIHHYKDGVWMDPDTNASIEGNVFEQPQSDQPNVFGDGEAFVDDNIPYWDADREMVGDGITELEERPLWPDGIEAMPAAKTRWHNLANVGARPADRTEHDWRLIKDVWTGDGERIDSQEEVGGYPDLPENTHDLRVPESGTRAWLRSWTRRVEAGRSHGAGRSPSKPGRHE
ncbi:pectate lyase [Halopiger aswanensis]|uniref:Pectate lyase n=1 Tax=Halopiger aswanensis TaxID=148449 RepID=A0A3R7KJ63_9EURY|nr:pectate lyase [Halopiger aswanensis]RKD89200.1 pectate lyase [Halopiger aswanensis]